ncbi:hypothetical protein [Inquilinus sp. CAU 1745]|uniref:hypothetical protein n=1 Tax=Inquilinus sp. CAU 1745 TaxID=3140369 RepID=UPI00325BEA69
MGNRLNLNEGVRRAEWKARPPIGFARPRSVPTAANDNTPSLRVRLKYVAGIGLIVGLAVGIAYLSF